MSVAIPCGMVQIPPGKVQLIAVTVLETVAMMNKDGALHPRKNMLALIFANSEGI